MLVPLARVCVLLQPYLHLFVISYHPATVRACKKEGASDVKYSDISYMGAFTFCTGQGGGGVNTVMTCVIYLF